MQGSIVQQQHFKAKQISGFGSMKLDFVRIPPTARLCGFPFFGIPLGMIHRAIILEFSELLPAVVSFLRIAAWRERAVSREQRFISFLL
jgi:hypothetical protein